MMNRIMLVAAGVALALLLGIGGLVLGQTLGESQGGAAPGSVNVSIPNQQVGIWVNGQGKVSVTPDVAVLQLGVEAQASTVSEAQSQASAAMDRVMKALTASGVAAKDIKTQSFSISKITRWDDKEQREIVVGYRVSNMVTARIRTVGKAGGVIDAVTEAGGDLTRIDSIAFTVDDPTPFQKQARDEAMADAKAKATQLAKLGGVTLGKPTYVSESSYVPYASVVRPAYDSDMAKTTPISPGEMEITVTVQVTYAINN